MALEPISDQERWALDYMISAEDDAAMKVHLTELKELLKPWILENGELDEDGNYVWEFPAPINLGDKSYTGLMAQRRVSEFINEEKADALVTKYGLEDRCLTLVTEIDFDALYAANQEGIISDEEIDDIIELNETYALVKIK